MSDKPSSYKKLNEELETILDNLQSSNLDVDKILSEYERGIDVVDKLEKYLKTAENKITKLSAKPAKSKK